MERVDIVNLGIFVADLNFRADRLPVIGETIRGEKFTMGPGGKGSNQAIASARAGVKTLLVSRIGDDNFGTLAQEAWAANGVDTRFIKVEKGATTGVAFIFVSSHSGDNAIIVESGAAANIEAQDLADVADIIKQAKIFMTQFEQPVAAALAGLKIARDSNVTTILNPAPAVTVDPAIYAFCDYVTPNETEAATLSGIDTSTDEGIAQAAHWFLARGADNVLITLGGRGVFFLDAKGGRMFPAFAVEDVVDTSGAGDAFNGGFAAALAEQKSIEEAIEFGCATAALSIQKPGTAPSLPYRSEIDDLLARCAAPS